MFGESGAEGEGLLANSTVEANHHEHQNHHHNHHKANNNGCSPAETANNLIGGGGSKLLHRQHSHQKPGNIESKEMMMPEKGGGGYPPIANHRWPSSLCGGTKRHHSRQLKRRGSSQLCPQPRLVAKNGECIIRPSNLRSPFSICLRNWFHLIIEHSWRRIFLIFATGFLTSWLTFGLVYWLIQHFSGNMQNLSEQRQCIANVHSLASAFLFSLESQHTIGYGTRYMTEACPLAYAVLSLQCIVGILLQTIMAGIVTAKILRPKKRKQEMRFSQSAVIGPLDDEDQRPALMIRLADIQHRLYIAESHVRLYMATTKINKRGECELIGVQDMNVGYDTGMDRVLLLWPVVIRHIIDQDSPLWEITEEKLKSCQFELIMTVEGIVEATGMAFQARTSFLSDEILWGQRFVPLIKLNPGSNQFEVDYDQFDVTESHPLDPWLPEEDRVQPEPTEQQQQEAMLPTKLAVISEMDCYATAHSPHLPNGMLMDPSAMAAAHHDPRRKSTCSVADSIRSGKVSSAIADELAGCGDSMAAVKNGRKTSRTSLLHVLLKRTGTNDSSPLVGHAIGALQLEEGGTLSPDGTLEAPLPPMPASPFVVHTLQHSGFT